MNNTALNLYSRFELVTVEPEGKELNRRRIDDPVEATDAFVSMSKEPFGPKLGIGSYVALKDRELELDASRLYEGSDTYRVQFGKYEGVAAYAAARQVRLDAASAVHARSEQVQNASIAAEYSERPKAEPATAADQFKQESKHDSSALDAATPAPRPVATLQPTNANSVESDEVFTAQQRNDSAMPPDIGQKFTQVGSRFSSAKTPDLVVFEDKGNKLETRSNGEAIAGDMVRIAEARGWNEIKVSGSETFRREVWLEAATRHMHVKGYNPSEQDLVELAKRDQSVDRNSINKDTPRFLARENDVEIRPVQAVQSEPTSPMQPLKTAIKVSEQSQQLTAALTLNLERAEAFRREQVPEVGTKDYPELAGSYAAAAAIDRKAEADGLSPQARAIIAARVRQNILNSIEHGELPSMSKIETIEVKKTMQEDRGVAR